MCGVIGAIGQGPVIGDIVDGLLFIQHRGQDAAGAATYDGSQFHLARRMGLVREAFENVDLTRFGGNMGIGHVRYPTIGGGGVEDAQPFHVNSPFGIAMAHNGNLTNFKPLRDELMTECRRHVGSSCDVEVILNVFADELTNGLPAGRRAAEGHDATNAIFDAVKGTLDRCRGSYSVVTIIAGEGLLAFRDPFGIKPLVYGRKRDGDGWRYLFASETCALSALGYEVVRDVRPGEAILIREGGEPEARQVRPANHHLCIFEFIYFARPDSMIDGVSVYKARMRLGEALARRWGESSGAGREVDTVIPVPDSSRPAAQQMAFRLGKPFREGLLKNRYIGRTFIMAGNAARKRGIRFKLAPVRLEIEGKHVLLVDDSIVRGNTANQIIQMVRDTGAEQVDMASSCPPLRFPCVYGIDMSTRSEFVATNRTEEDVRQAIGADALLYQSIDDMVQACTPPDEDSPRRFCMACMDGHYPTGDVTEEVIDRIEAERLEIAETVPASA